MKANFLNNRKKIIFSIIIGFLVLAGMAYVLTNFLMDKILIKKQALEKQQLSLDYLIKEGTKVDKYQALSDKMNDNQLAVKEAIITKENQLKLIKSLEAVADSLGIYIKKSSYDPPKKSKKIVQENASAVSGDSAQSPQSSKNNKNLNYLKVSYIGSYENLLKFIYKIENFEYAVNLNSLEMKVLEKSDFRRLERELNNPQQVLSGAELKADILLSFKST